MASRVSSQESQTDPKSHARPIGMALIAALVIAEALVQIESGLRLQTGVALYGEEFQGLLSLALGWGLWKGKSWAWALLIITSVIGIIFLVFAFLGAPFGNGLYFNAVGLALDLLFIYYATRGNVMAYFGISSIRKEFE